MTVKTITEEVILETDTCCVCSILHAIPKVMKDNAHNKGGFWYCPNGHHIGWDEANSKTGLQKLRDENASLRSSLSYKDQQIESERRQKIEIKKTLTRERNRAKNGVCPCCHRSFVQLARHMKTKHPGFGDGD